MPSTPTAPVAALALLLAALSPAAARAAQRSVRLDSGPVVGVPLEGATVYRGLPYAAAPTGALRWRDPRPPKPWTRPRDAMRFAPACPQTGVSMPGEPPSATSEDCLYLNVWTPAGRSGARLPVIVWFPGGGFANGATGVPIYDGLALARRGAVVAIAGQSAGATSVSILMASPRAAGLFHRAIGQSGGLFEPLEFAPNYRLDRAEAAGAAWAETKGATTAAALRALPVEALLAGAGPVTHPVIEPRLLPRPPYDAFVTGRHNDVPLLTGFNAEEARSLTAVADVTAANFAAKLKGRWGDLPAPLIAAYPFRTDEEARDARLRFERDLRFGWDARTWAGLQAAHGRAPVYAYSFRRRLPAAEGAVQRDWGASHFAELWYMFDNLAQEPWPWTDGDRALAGAMADYWVRFARDGDPNGPGLPAWPAFTTQDPGVQRLDTTLSHGPLPDAEGLKVFDAVYGAIRRPPS